LPSSPDRPTIHLTRAHHEMWGKIYRGLMPWAAWLILTVAGFTVRIVFGHWLWLLVILVLVSGLVLAGLTLHLHSNRISAVGKMIGPVTTVAGSVLTAAWLMAGWSVPLLLVYFFGGVVACLGWDVWMHVGVSHDITRAFGPASEAAFGKPARLSMTRAPKAAADPAAPARSRASRSRAPRTMTGRVMMPPEVTVSEGAERVEGLEQNLGFPPGSVTLRQSPDDPWADFTASDPHLLDVPEPWPGPSRPHGTMAEPFRMGVRQDGSTALIRRLPNYHTRGMGQTGSAKTMGWGYNQLGEGVSREEYAAIVFDFAKGEQFFGAWRMALHYFETEEERILRRMAGLHRARVARTNYLAKSHLTEWEPGCGLSFLDIFMAEAPDVIRLLAVGKRASAGAVMTREDWESDVKNYRSAGGSWNLDLQLSLASEMPSVAQGQMSHLTMGVEDRKQAAFGLSDRQKEGGCRPELWGKRKPGMAYWDVPTEDESLALMPLRFYHWRDGARQAFEYAQQWPAADRPLDDVTGEALEAEPALPPSYALPGPGGTLAGTGRPPAGNVRGLFDRRKPAGPTAEEKAREREQAVMAQFDKWEASGKVTFTSLDLQATGIAQRLGVSRPWLYGVIDTATARGRLELAADKPKRVWRIVPQQRLQAEEE
jgi:hypothetical protein